MVYDLRTYLDILREKGELAEIQRKTGVVAWSP